VTTDASTSLSSITTPYRGVTALPPFWRLLQLPHRYPHHRSLMSIANHQQFKGEHNLARKALIRCIPSIFSGELLLCGVCRSRVIRSSTYMTSTFVYQISSSQNVHYCHAFFFARDTLRTNGVFCRADRSTPNPMIDAMRVCLLISHHHCCRVHRETETDHGW
jgi:hypothetical protein